MNFNKLDYKQKTRLLLAGFGLTLLLCYQLAFKNTISLYFQYRHNYVSEDELQSRLRSYDQLLARQKRLNQLISVSGKPGFRNYEQQILESVARSCAHHGVDIKSYSPFSSYQYENMTVFTQIFTVEGGFRQILRCINDLENDSIPLKIAALTFNSVVTHESDTPRLTGTVYLQQLSLNENDHAN